MLAKLNRDEFIELLETLGDEADEVALRAARDIHARITVAGIDWDALLLPEQNGADPEPVEEEELDEDPDDDGDQVPDDDGDGDIGAADDPAQARLTGEEREEALSLIASLLKKGVSADTKEELEGYREDLDEGEFEQTDLKYLRALSRRLSGGS